MTDVKASQGAPSADQYDVSGFEGYEGEKTELGGRVLKAMTAVLAVAWVVAMVQILRLPVQETETTMETAIWTGVAIGAGIGTFILGVWQVHRA